MADETVLEYDLQFVETPFKVIINKTDPPKWYVIRELSGAERDKYLQGTINRARTDGDGKVTGVKDMTGYQAALLCLGVRAYDPDTKTVIEGALDPSLFQGWPARVQDDIFKRIQKLSALDTAKEKQEDDAKKS